MQKTQVAVLVLWLCTLKHYTVIIERRHISYQKWKHIHMFTKLFQLVAIFPHNITHKYMKAGKQDPLLWNINHYCLLFKITQKINS